MIIYVMYFMQGTTCSSMPLENVHKNNITEISYNTQKLLTEDLHLVFLSVHKYIKTLINKHTDTYRWENCLNSLTTPTTVYTHLTTVL